MGKPISIDVIADGPFVSRSLRQTAAEHADKPGVAARLHLAADVIDALLKQLALVEGQARVNAETVIRQANEMRKIVREGIRS